MTTKNLRGIARDMRAVLRSLSIYRGNSQHRRSLDSFYNAFIKPGDLAFDIGAHVGDRAACFRRLGARVVAVEPQPVLARTLRAMFVFRRGVTVEAVAVGASVGEIELLINADNPTVSTASRDFVKAAAGAPGWETQSWSKTIRVPLTTLDALITRHGKPSFIKIDVEGFEADSLAGLSKPVPALSFEFTTIQRDVAHECLRRCAALGYRSFNAVLGESLRFEFPQWQDTEFVARWVDALPQEANSGDIYARMSAS